MSSPVRSGRKYVPAGGLLVVALLLSGCAATAPTPAATYGGVPDYLRGVSSKATDRVLSGSAARPALTTEGDAVDVKVAGGSARATVVGPEVPGEGLPYQAVSTTCTWTVTLTGVSGSVPVAASEFSSIDHFGNMYAPYVVPGSVTPAVSAPSGGSGGAVPSVGSGAVGPSSGSGAVVLPGAVAPGQTVTFELRAVMRVGEGLMRWAPSGATVASWDFEVEND